MAKNILIIAAILVIVLLAYSLGKKQDNAQVSDLKVQLDTLKTQMDVQSKNLKASYHRLHRSINLHMSETSIEAAIHETLDQNFGQARIALDSARGYLKGAIGEKVSSADINALSDELKTASGQLKQLDKGAIASLNEADRQVRKLILQNSR